MYLEYFGLADFPFIQSAKNALFFSTEKTLAQCSIVHHWLDAGHGLLLVSGEQGVGRASFAHHALDTSMVPITERYVIGRLPLTPTDLLLSLATEMGIETDCTEPMALRHVIRTQLRIKASLTQRICVVVPDGDKLDTQTLAFLYDLSEDHTLYLPLCHVLLLVDKPFANAIKRQKRQAGARHIHRLVMLRSLSLSETSDYIDHRMQQAGAVSDGVFTAATIKQVFQQTKGKTQLINILCDIALVNCYNAKAKNVTLKHILDAVRSLGWEVRFKPAALQQKKKIAPHQSRDRSACNNKASTRLKLGALERSVHELVSGVTTIGRAPDCSIRIDGANISPYQSLIVRTDDGMFIRNEGSAVPLYLNGGRVESANLAAGDSISIGSYRFAVDLDSDGKLTLLSSMEKV